MSHRNKRRKNRNLKLFLCVLVELGVIALLVFLLLLPQKVHRKVIIEAGAKKPDVSEFLKGNNKGSFLTDLSQIDSKEIGTYTIRIKVEGKTYKSKLVIEDTVAPKATDSQKIGALGFKLNALTCVKDVEDATKVTAHFEKEPNWTQSGAQHATVILKDEGKNETKVKVTIHLLKDQEAPIIQGVKDQTILINGTISYKKGVTVTDNQDKNPNLSINTSMVNLQKEGSYVVTYIATDQAGNKAKLKATIRVISQRESKIMIEGVPLICQKPKLPTGCEIVAATMVLQFYNENIVEEEFANKWIEKDDFFYIKDEKIFGPDPSKVFVGNPFEKSSYGCFAMPIVQAINSNSKKCKAKLVKENTLKELCQNYINYNKPLLIWASMGMRPLANGDSWYLEDGSILVWPAGEHCLVLVGYSSDSYYFNDPQSGKVIEFKAEIVESVFKELGSQAICIEMK